MDAMLPLSSLGCLLLGASIHFALHLVYGTRGPQVGDPLYLVLRITGSLFLGLSLFAFSALVAHALGVLLAVIAVIVAIMVHRRNVQMRRRSLLAVLAASVEKGVPLAPTLMALADEYPGSMGRRTRQLATAIDQGSSLEEAIEQVPHALPMLTAVYARTGALVDAPGQALREAAHTQTIQHTIWQGVSGRIYYLAALMLLSFGLLSFVVMKIVPIYESLFIHYGYELPAIFGWLSFLSSHAHAVNAALVILGLFCVVIAIVVFRALEMGWSSRSPLVDRLLTRVHSTVVLRVLALATERNQPLGPIFETLGQSYPHRRIAEKMRDIAYHVAQGDDWCECLRQRKLIGPMELAVMQAAGRVGNLPWAMREMADSGLRRLALRINLTVQLIFPGVLCIAGLMVAFLVVSLFVPLVTLITNLSY